MQRAQKAKRGRPPLAPEDARRNRVVVMLTDNELGKAAPGAGEAPSARQRGVWGFHSRARPLMIAEQVALVAFTPAALAVGVRVLVVAKWE